jgi:hypothetical protein
MLLAFELTMPNVGSWNGKWTGADKKYIKVLNITQRYGTSKAARLKSAEILKERNYYYNFGDGWGANVSVKTVNAKEAARFRNESAGFCGYEWMVDSILKYGKILNKQHRFDL